MPIVLVVDDSEVDRRLIGGLLETDIEWLVEYAENGKDAISRIGDIMPDLVVTDLQMPEMDGIELIKAINKSHSEVPVLVATAHGSESAAVEALTCGAASYVPKAEVAKTLPDTVQKILEMASHERRLERLDESVVSQRYTYRLANDPELIPPLVDRVRRKLRDMKLSNSTQRMQVGIALEEAILNALYHGNLHLPAHEWSTNRAQLRHGKMTDFVKNRMSSSPYAERVVLVGLEISRRRLRFVIRDEGDGFDTSSVPKPLDGSSVRDEGGRGLVLMRNFMQELSFNDIGNEVTMITAPISEPPAKTGSAATVQS